MSNYSHGKLQVEERNTSWTKIYEYTPEGSTVLDVGCSDGALGRQLKDMKNSTVYGIEIDKQDFLAAKKVLDGVFDFNIEQDDIPKTLEAIKFDVIIVADVVEHFVNPIKALKTLASLLKDSGRIIFSIPNMAHISVRLQLLGGQFNYNETGLLDKTHLHYYDFHEVQRVFYEAGLQIEHNDANTLPYTPSFLREKLDSLGLADKGFIKKITNDRYAQTFQFVGFARPVKNNKDINKIALSTTTPEKELVSYIENLKDTNALITSENQILRKNLENTELELAQVRHKLSRITNSLPGKLVKSAMKLAKKPNES